MEKNNSIQKPGLRKHKFGSKAHLRIIKKRLKNKTIRKKKNSLKS